MNIYRGSWSGTAAKATECLALMDFCWDGSKFHELCHQKTGFLTTQHWILCICFLSKAMTFREDFTTAVRKGQGCEKKNRPEPNHLGGQHPGRNQVPGCSWGRLFEIKDGSKLSRTLFFDRIICFLIKKGFSQQVFTWFWPKVHSQIYARNCQIYNGKENRRTRYQQFCAFTKISTQRMHNNTKQIHEHFPTTSHNIFHKSHP